MTVVLAILQARPDRADRLAELLTEAAELTRREPGALSYGVARRDGGMFLVHERYADQAACDAHFAAPYVTGLLAAFPDLLESDPQVIFAEEIAGFGTADRKPGTVPA